MKPTLTQLTLVSAVALALTACQRAPASHIYDPNATPTPSSGGGGSSWSFHGSSGSGGSGEAVGSVSRGGFGGMGHGSASS